jgi:glutathione S-transferase
MMMWMDLVVVLVLAQQIFFSFLVGGARAKYGVKAPATSGHPQFERLHRVQMNSLEQLVILLPAMVLASRYWSPTSVALGGAVYLLGRFVYWRTYIQDPAKRTVGFALTVLPIWFMLGATLVGIVMKGSV